MEARDRFGALFAHTRTVPLSDAWIEAYEQRRVLNRRPTLVEFHRGGSSIIAMRQQFGRWFEFVALMGDLDDLAKGVFIGALPSGIFFAHRVGRVLRVESAA